MTAFEKVEFVITMKNEKFFYHFLFENEKFIPTLPEPFSSFETINKIATKSRLIITSVLIFCESFDCSIFREKNSFLISSLEQYYSLKVCNYKTGINIECGVCDSKNFLGFAIEMCKTISRKYEFSLPIVRFSSQLK